MSSEQEETAAGSGWLTGLFCFWVFVLGCTGMRTWDIWWHLAAGERILELGTVPRVDVFTYSSLDRSWIDLHWGFQVLVTVVYQRAGVTGLVLLKALCFALSVLIGWLASGRELPGWLKAGAWTIAVFCLMARSMVRPEMLSLIFLGLWLWALHDPRRVHRRTWILPFVQLLWVNCHGIFALGYAVGAAYVVGYAVDRWLRTERAKATQLRSAALTLAAVLSLLASLANPYFLQGTLFPEVLYRKFSTDRVFYENLVTEFRSPLKLIEQLGWLDHRVWPLVVLAIAIAISFAWLACNRRLNPFRLVLFLGFGFLALQANRNVNLFALVGGVILCGNLTDLLAMRANSAEEQSPTPRRRWLNGASTACVVVAILAAFMSIGWRGPIGKFYVGPLLGWYAYHAAKFAGTEGLPPRAFVAHFGQAALYVHHHGPERKVFMDGRLEVASRETAETYVAVKQAIANSDPRFVDLVKDSSGQVPVVMLDFRRSRALVQGMQTMPGWRLVFHDNVAAVYIEESLADKLEMPAVELPEWL